MWRVIRRSTTTGRTLKVMFEGSSRRECEIWREGFGTERSPKHVLVVEHVLDGRGGSAFGEPAATTREP